MKARTGLGADELAELYAAHRVSLVRLAILLVDDLASAEDVVVTPRAGHPARQGLQLRRQDRAWRLLSQVMRLMH